MAHSYHFDIFGAETVDDLTSEQLDTLVAYEIQKSQKEKEAYDKAASHKRSQRGGRTMSVRTKT